MRILKSPRRRRRLIKIAVVLAFIPLVYIGVRLSTSGNPENASGPEVPNYVQPKRSPFTADEQRAVHPVLAQFIKDVGLEVFVFPKPGSGYSAMTAAAEVIKDRDGRWLVNYWMPERFHGPPALSAKQLKAATKTARAFKKKSPSTHKTAAPPPAALNQPRASRIWLLLPVGILSLIILAPLALLIIGLLRTRREARQSLGT